MNSLKKLVFATHNQNKLKEIQQMLGVEFELLSLSDIGCVDDIPETADTLEGNALQKARFVREKFGLDVFADDTGLMVDALGGAPGVYSARYAGPQRDARDNISKLLSELEGRNNRSARFVTAIALLYGDDEQVFTGEVEGRIINDLRGEGGFGYDPVFMPEGYSQTFAEMDAVAKNSISHRGRAFRKLIDHLQNTMHNF